MGLVTIDVVIDIPRREYMSLSSGDGGWTLPFPRGPYTWTVTACGPPPEAGRGLSLSHCFQKPELTQKRHVQVGDGVRVAPRGRPLWPGAGRRWLPGRNHREGSQLPGEGAEPRGWATRLGQGGLDATLQLSSSLKMYRLSPPGLRPSGREDCVCSCLDLPTKDREEMLMGDLGGRRETRVFQGQL